MAILKEKGTEKKGSVKSFFFLYFFFLIPFLDSPVSRIAGIGVDERGGEEG